LGSKMADDVYNDEDYHILDTVASHAATTARNVRLVRELRQRLEEIARSKQELQQAHQRLLVGREEERKRLAREIHDGPIQTLVEISYQLREYERQSPGVLLPESVAKLRRENSLLLENLRHICTDLRPPGLDISGLAIAIRAHVSEEIKSGPSIVLDLDDDGQQLKDAAIALFRIYQEALTNALRHAHATQITIQLRVSCDSCVLSIKDNGQGFIAPSKRETLAYTGHLGLLGMQERSEAMRGRLEIFSSPGMGTEVRAWMPLDAKRDA
jgi:signal transduction histidine kinase